MVNQYVQVSGVLVTSKHLIIVVSTPPPKLKGVRFKGSDLKFPCRNLWVQALQQRVCVVTGVATPSVLYLSMSKHRFRTFEFSCK